MRKVLYLLSEPPRETLKSLLSPSTSSDEEVSVILIEDGASLGRVPGQHVYVLAEDVASRKTDSKFPKVSYRDMLRMIFEADTVITI